MQDKDKSVLFEASIESVVKSISKNRNISLKFELENINFSEIKSGHFDDLYPVVLLPKINHDSSQVRAFADLAALYLGDYHDQIIHNQYLPLKTNQQEIFEELEKFRLILLGIADFKGMVQNFMTIIKSESDNLSPKSISLLLLKDSEFDDQALTANLKILEKILSQKIIDKIWQLKSLIKSHKLFASKSLELIDLIEDFSQEKKAQSKNQINDQENKENQKQESSINQESSLIKENFDDHPKDKERIVDGSNANNNQTIGLSLIDDKTKQNDDEFLRQARIDSSRFEVKKVKKYQIFTKKYDQIIRAENLSNSKELENLRQQLDLKLKQLNKVSQKLAIKLKRKLLSKRNFFFENNKDEGLIDQKKNTQIITRPLLTNRYVTINDDQYQDTAISILIDNSGSMRGTPIVMSAMASEIIVSILERFAIKTEILGFTTCEWRGGKSRKLWEISRKTSNPGRISDLRHIIYKDFYQNLKKTKNNLGLMLKEGILKENIDGEALTWAASRLISCNEKRKILIVISDGTPIDDSTNSNNEEEILINHLHQTINKIEKHSKIEVAAIGIGHNVSDFYQNSITIKNIEELGDVMISKICNLL